MSSVNKGLLIYKIESHLITEKVVLNDPASVYVCVICSTYRLESIGIKLKKCGNS